MSIYNLIASGQIELIGYSPNGYNAMVSALSNLYANSSIARGYFNNLSSVDVLTYSYTQGVAEGDLHLYAVRIDDSYDSFYINSTGTVVKFSLERLIMHETLHAIGNNIDDPRVVPLDGSVAVPEYGYAGDAVRLTDPIMAQLGEAARNTYSNADPYFIQIGQSFTFGNSVDIILLSSPLTENPYTGVKDCGLNPQTYKNTVNTGDLIIDVMPNNYSTIISGLGDDYIYARDGNDTIRPGAGSDYIDGGFGIDTVAYNYYEGDASGVPTHGIIATWDASGATVIDGYGDVDQLVLVEKLYGTGFDDTFVITGDFTQVARITNILDADGLGVSGNLNNTNGDTLILDVNRSVNINLDTGILGSSLEAIIVEGFENVIGSSHGEMITGNGADNILYGGEGRDWLSGGAGDDILVFDGADPSVEGGIGRDVGIVTGEAGVTVDLAAQGLEVVVGGAGADNFTLNGQGDTRQMVAGGGGVDTFTINVGNSSETVVVWGGEGADRFQMNSPNGTLGIMTVNIDGLTDENFADFDLDMLGLGSGFNWGAIDVVVVNPDRSDRFYTGNEYTNDTTDDASIIRVRDGSVGINVTDTNTGDTFLAYSQTMSLLAGSYDAFAVGMFDASFLNSGTMSIQTSVEVLTSGYLQPIDPDTGEPYDRSGSIYGEDDPDTPEYEGDPFPEWSDLRLGTADYDTRYSFGATTDIDAIGDETNAFFWINYFSPNAPEWHNEDGPNPYGYAAGVDTLSDVGTLSSPVGPWFVVGGGFDDQRLSSNGTITATMPDIEPSFSLTDWLASITGGTGTGGGNNTPSSTTNINSGSGTTTIQNFNTGSNYLIYNGAAVDPTDTAAGYTISQVGTNIEIDFGNGDVVTLENTALADWQTAATTQNFGSGGDDVLTGTPQGETFVSGAGNDVINTGKGDDTIVYTSGDDVITGHGTMNYGNDTLDLSKYTADQVSFRIVGHDVLIDTPDGTIELDYQVRYELGHTRSNIENILFSDGTLNEAAIRDRAISDQSSVGDDVVTGSFQTDIISAGAGNDVVDAWYGDDTITYTSGNDVISGHGGLVNYGNDTLDLSKYTADQVSFRIAGHDVFIDTPDGTIELDYQVRYEVGHTRSNIENIIFSDGTLDEAGIADRAIADQATAGDDMISGSFQSETIAGGTGNDTLSGVNGSDTFVFAIGDGVDHITDYIAANDTLEFTGISYAGLTITQVGSDVLIEYGTSDQVIVDNSVIANFDEPEFLFA